MRSIVYNSQRNNKSHFENSKTFSAWNQCFSTCAVMLMSYYCPAFKGDDDDILASYLYDVEDSLNKQGIGAEIRQQMHLNPALNSSYFFAVQAAGIEKWMDYFGRPGTAMQGLGFKITDLPDMMLRRPAIISTHKLGNLPDGHMILLVDFDFGNEQFKVNDPFGNANTNYVDQNGDSVMYHFEMLTPYIGNDKHPELCNILYFIEQGEVA
jgi:hypothetical protein